MGWALLLFSRSNGHGSLVILQPILAKTLERAGELLKVHGFSQVTVGPVTITIDNVLTLCRRTQNDRRNKPGATVSPHSYQHFQAAHFGQFEIEQDYIRHHIQVTLRMGPFAKKPVKSFGAVPYDSDRARDSSIAQGVNRQQFVILAIIN